MCDQTPIEYRSEFESSPMNFCQANLILFQPNSPLQLRINCSPNNLLLQDYYSAQLNQNQEDLFPFDQQPLQKMFELQISNEESSEIQQIVIKQSHAKQKGFQIFHVNTQQMTPQKYNNQKMNRHQAFLKNISNSEKIEKKNFNQYQYQEQTPLRSQKGLRNLSVKVRDIVMELKSTTYKDVAQRLIQDLGQDGQLLDLDNPKDEQNIKRRVYDALNVMIASKVLKKEGKKVISGMQGKTKTRRNETDNQKEELQTSKSIIKEKKKRLKELFTKMIALENLIKRNSTNELKNKFMFPILTLQGNQQQIKLRMDSKVLKIMSQQRLVLHADLDILVQMKMQLMYKNDDLFIPNELLDIVQVNEFCF
ncbi:unnamed protein product [Paramecium octaurelia]|uniref:E2F/DP family winged-helix DNA-binding domain-containing protein n=1 Tax=Paramecium octaurelia TaxID=43137 RepID=A0A8S1T7Q9_PAROT|nr:unnamed protein product [Paramecium octaurelia]